jgi:hypothetical protein
MNASDKPNLTKNYRARPQWLLVLLIVQLVTASALAQAWESLPDMSPRHRHVAAGGHLANGDGRVFVFGGLVFGPANKTVDAFNPINVNWEVPGTYPDMPISRMLASVATDSSDKIYIIGGIGPSNINLASVDVFDPSALPSGPWSTLSGMSTARNSAGATFGPDGKLYVIGGLNASGGQRYDVVERYDPSSTIWDTLAPLPMPLPGNGGSPVGAAVGCDGSIIAVSNSWPGGGSCTAHTFAYNIGEDKWYPRAGMPGCLGGRGVVRGPNGLIYAVNDGNYFETSPGDTRVYSYDSAADSWAAASDTLVGHKELAVAALGDRIYALGGTSKHGAKVGLRFESLVTGVASWEPIPGMAQDIGVGADGTAWKIGTIPRIGGFDIAKLNGSSWVGITGGAVRIDVDPQGDPWVVNSNGSIYKYTQNSQSWLSISGSATDIGIGSNGVVWKIGTTPVIGGFNIARWDGSSWIGIGGGAIRIDVDSLGDPWVVNANGSIYKYSQALNKWDSLQGQATDIGIGANNAVWKTGAPPGDVYGFKISKWNGTGWDTPVDGAAEEISVGPDGTPWVVNLLDAIYHRH